MSSLLLHNKLHLHQAWDTLFANGPLKDYLGTEELGKGAQDILNGEFNLHKADSILAINHWPKHQICRMVPTRSIHVSLTKEEFKEAMHKQDEKTSMPPSGQHYGHYEIILAFNDIYKAYATTMSLLFLFGFVPTY
eukprot:12336618-Ditylum_brightwellii.AAC.1